MRAIDADVLKQHINKLPALPDGNFAGNHSALKALINMQPTIEPSTNCSEFPNNSDTISREAVADAINGIECTRHTTWYEFYQKVMTAVEKLPSAQPEIIRCKDCKYMIDTGDDLMCDNAKGWVVATASDFGCVLAERRTDG